MDSNAFKKKRKNPRQHANILSRLFFCWTLPTLRKGYHTNVTEEDLFVPLKEHECSKLGDKLEKLWQKELKKTKPSLWKAILRLFVLDFILLGFVYTLNELLKLAQVIALGNLILYYSMHNSGITTKEAYINASAIVGINLLNTIIIQNYFMAMQHIGMKVRISCSALIYRKLLRLSQRALLNTTAGQLVNLISNDVSRFDIGVVHLHGMMAAPLVVGVAMYLTNWIVGPVACIGLAVFVAIIPLQIYVAHKISGYRLKTAERTDERVRLMNEIIKGVKVIKMFTWETLFTNLVEIARKLEISEIRGAAYLRGLILSFQVFTTRIAIFMVILAYVLLHNTPTAHYVFFVTSFYNTLRVVLTVHVPTGMYEGAEICISMRRIREILLYEEQVDKKQIDDVTRVNNANGVHLQYATAKWNEFSSDDSLTDITLSVTENQLLAITGPVGSGKSSLLQLILKELPLVTGTCRVDGTISYFPQEPWLFRDTIRQNIIFGQPFDAHRYYEVLRVCALEYDLNFLPYGDKTLVGDRGAMLSGGQKARINLARVVYRDADIYLLDDPLSAVDAIVGRDIFNNCILTFLKNKIVVLVTHQVQYLTELGNVVFMEAGRVTAKGSFEELERHLVFKDFQKVLAEGDSKVTEAVEADTQESVEAEEVPDVIEVKTGSLSGHLYSWYCKAGGGKCVAVCLFLMFVVSQISASFSDYFITFWVNMEEMKAEEAKTKTRSILEIVQKYFTPEICIYIYTGVITFLVIETSICTYAFFKFCINASAKIHKDMFSKIVHANMQFFDIHPPGSILNRFSEDIGAVDEILPVTVSDTLQIGTAVLGAIVITGIVNYWLLIPTAIFLLICLRLRKFYLATSRNVKRLEAKTRNPLYSHISTTLQGLTTIRAFEAQPLVKEEFETYQDTHSSAYYLFMGCTRVFSIWVDTILCAFVALVIYSFLLFDKGVLAGDVGLAITQALSLTGLVQWGLRQWTEFENQMISVERISEFAEITPESTQEDTYFTAGEGRVEFRDVSLTYALEERALKNISFVIQPKEKIGVVGRTGAGKSSLVTALFRLHRTDGAILIDHNDVSRAKLQTLRSKISIIPQEPVLFSSSLRRNLDPYDQYSDEELWSALEDVELKQKVFELDARVLEDGANFSVGQRQLLCLARAILRKNKILVLDEATANVDHKTDELIQKAIRRNFEQCTVITIAHRLHTVLDSDRVMVLDDGRVVEFDSPQVLLEDKESLFYRMVQQTGERVVVG